MKLSLKNQGSRLVGIQIPTNDVLETVSVAQNTTTVKESITIVIAIATKINHHGSDQMIGQTAPNTVVYQENGANVKKKTVQVIPKSN